MSKIIASADITRLDFSVLLDMSMSVPIISITNLSTVINPLNLQWAFVITSPSGTPVHTGSLTLPDINHTPFTTFIFTEALPMLFGQLEFNSTGQYTVIVSVKDAAGLITTLQKSNSICKPNGNNGRDNFGAAIIDVEVKCGSGQVYITDQTNLVYKSLTGIKFLTSGELTYPKDGNGNILPPVTVSGLPALLPIKYEGNGHEVYVYQIYDYDLGDNFIVRVRYSYTHAFGVWCNVTLQPLFCEIDRANSMLSKNCNDNADSREQQRKLTVINSKMLKAHTGIIQPLSGIDVPGVVEEIKQLLGVDCDCCRPAGISNVGALRVTDANFRVNKICGDMLLGWEKDLAGNITLNYQNSSYTFVMSPALGNSTAFSYQVVITGCNKAVNLFVDLETLSTEILTHISGNSTLLNILKDLTQKAQLSCSSLSGGAAFDFTSCDYSSELSTAQPGGTIADILIGGVTYIAPLGTLLSDAAATGAWLNSLAKGVFIVNYSALTARTTITSAANTNSISTVRTLNGTIYTTTLFSNNCGLICNILQKILNWLNAINMVQLKAGTGLTICRFKEDGTVISQVFSATAKASEVVEYMAGSFCNITNYIHDKLLTCANLQGVFAAHTEAIGEPDGADVFPMFVNGKCQQVPLRNAAISIFRMLSTDTEVKSTYCLGAKCTTVSDCSPVTGLLGVPNDTGATYNWNTVAGAIGYKWSVDGINWTNVTATTALITGVLPGTTYNIRVYPVYNSGDGINCMVYNEFTTTNAALACQSVNNLTVSNVVASSFVISWDAITGVTGYQYRVNGGGWINTGNVLAVQISGLTPSTVYNLEVRAILGGNPCPQTASIATTTAACNPPVIISATLG